MGRKKPIHDGVYLAIIRLISKSVDKPGSMLKHLTLTKYNLSTKLRLLREMNLVRMSKPLTSTRGQLTQYSIDYAGTAKLAFKLFIPEALKILSRDAEDYFEFIMKSYLDEIFHKADQDTIFKKLEGFVVYLSLSSLMHRDPEKSVYPIKSMSQWANIAKVTLSARFYLADKYPEAFLMLLTEPNIKAETSNRAALQR